MKTNNLTRYVAFLRGINVGGNNLIKMEELRRALAALRFKNVRTFIASGNVIFESGETKRELLAAQIERKVRKSFGHEISVVLQTIDDLKRILKVDAFKKVKPGKDTMLFVVLLASEPPRKPKLPLRNKNGSLELLAIKHRAAFIVCYRKPNGFFEFPNNYFEKEFGVIATTRNWSTLNRIVAFAENL